MSDYSHKNLRELPDRAAGRFAETQEARFAQGDLGAKDTGVSLHRVKPNCRQAFGHRHEEAEEVYVVLSGSGRVQLDEEVIELAPLDAVRVAPRVGRRFEGGPEGLDFLAFGPHHEKDGEILEGFGDK